MIRTGCAIWMLDRSLLREQMILYHSLKSRSCSPVFFIGLLQSWEREGLRPSQPFLCGALGRRSRPSAPQGGFFRGPAAPKPPPLLTLQQPYEQIACLTIVLAPHILMMAALPDAIRL